MYSVGMIRRARDSGTMSQVFEGYERQYCEISANLARKCTSAGLLDGGKREPNLVAVMNAQFFVLSLK